MLLGPTAPSGLDLGLSHLEVLAVDCQSTGANPEHGHLLELAWSRLRAAREPAAQDAQASLVALPEGAKVPRRVSTITGIKAAQLQGAPQPGEVWSRLVATARQVATANGTVRAPAVAHFARFERPFLEALHRDHSMDQPFPLVLVCTHEIACRLLPGLPRRGLRALSGYLGHVLDEHRRAAAHVVATEVIWRELVVRLEHQGVHTLADLLRWLGQVQPTREGGRELPYARERRLALPDEPGVYRMLGKGGEVLYLGKATSLRRRVNSYFQRPRHANPRTMEMLTQAWDIEVTRAASPLEAALLEADEIKRLNPPYNVALRQRHTACWFASDDLCSVRAEPDARHRLGPLPAQDSLAGAALLRGLLAGEASLLDGGEGQRWSLGLPAVEPRELRQGVELLRVRLGLHPAQRLTAALLDLHGARLWRARRFAQDAAAGEGDVERPASLRVATALESLLLHSARLLRRASWLLRLAHCALRWQPRVGSTGGRALVLEQGRVIQASDLAPGAEAPTLQVALPAHQRRLAFDAVVHDRLRVLTTELRRLVTQRWPLTLWLGTGEALGRRALARRLSHF